MIVKQPRQRLPDCPDEVKTVEDHRIFAGRNQG